MRKSKKSQIANEIVTEYKKRKEWEEKIKRLARLNKEKEEQKEVK